MPPPPPDPLIAALLAAVLGVFGPATGFVVAVLRPAPTTACGGWEAPAQQLAPAGVTPSARTVVPPPTGPGAASPGWQELAAKLSGELANSDDPEAQKLAQSIGDTGTPDTTGSGSPSPRTTTAPRTSAAGSARPAPGDAGAVDTAAGGTGTGTRNTTAPGTGAPGAARPMPGDDGAGDDDTGDDGAGDDGAGDSASSGTTTSGPSHPSAPGPSAQARSGTGPCPPLPGRGTPTTAVPSTRIPSTSSPSPGARSTAGRATASTTRPTSSSRNGDQRWEQLASELAAALAGSTDPRAAILQDALDRSGFAPARTTKPGRATGSAPRTTAIPVPVDPGNGG